MIVERYFQEAATDKHLQILSIKGLVEAASRFIDKDDRDALACVVEYVSYTSSIAMLACVV